MRKYAIVKNSAVFMLGYILFQCNSLLTRINIVVHFAETHPHAGRTVVSMQSAKVNLHSTAVFKSNRCRQYELNRLFCTQAALLFYGTITVISLTEKSQFLL